MPKQRDKKEFIAAGTLLMTLLLIWVLAISREPEPTQEVEPAPVQVQATPTPKPRVIFDIMTVVNKTPAEVARVLGKPSKLETDNEEPDLGCNVTPCQTGIYQDRFMIDFVRGKSGIVRLFLSESIPFDANAITVLGLPPATPTSMGKDGQGVIIWNPPGFKDIWYHGPGDMSKYGTFTVRTVDFVK